MLWASGLSLSKGWEARSPPRVAESKGEKRGLGRHPTLQGLVDHILEVELYLSRAKGKHQRLTFTF